MADPAVDNVVAITGGGSSNTGRMFVQLKPLKQRKIAADRVIARLRGKLSGVPGATLFLQAVQDVSVGGRSSNSQFQYTLQGDTIAELQKWANIMLDAIKALPQVRDSNTDLQNKGLEARVVEDGLVYIDHYRALQLRPVVDSQIAVEHQAGQPVGLILKCARFSG